MYGYRAFYSTQTFVKHHPKEMSVPLGSFLLDFASSVEIVPNAFSYAEKNLAFFNPIQTVKLCRSLNYSRLSLSLSPSLSLSLSVCVCVCVCT